MAWHLKTALRRWHRGGALTLLLSASMAASGTVAPAGPAKSPATSVTADAARVAGWAITSGDHGGRGFVVIDKRAAQVFAFARDGTLLGTAPALLGAARGDVNPPGIGDRPLSAIGPQDRITAAGRFVARLGNDLGKADILWIDYDSSLSLHRVIRGRPSDERARRLASPTPDDNRISYGCVNVPAAYFDDIVKPLVGSATAIVYVLPETRSLVEVFPGLASR